MVVLCVIRGFAHQDQDRHSLKIHELACGSFLLPAGNETLRLGRGLLFKLQLLRVRYSRRIRNWYVCDASSKLLAAPSNRGRFNRRSVRLNRHNCLHERCVLSLAFLREMTHCKVASHTGMPIGTVKTHVSACPWNPYP